MYEDEVSWQTTLKVVAVGVFTGLFRQYRYDDLRDSAKDFLYEVASFVAQVLCLLLFPISIPLLFLVVRKAQKDTAEQHKKYIEKVAEQRRMQRESVIKGVE